jgi:hypothetical protein
VTAAAAFPVITAADVFSDRQWFFDHPGRRYRARRRGREVMLRVFAAAVPKSVPDNDEAWRGIWFSVAWPTLQQDELKELVDAARQLERGPGRRTAGARHGSGQPRSPPLPARGRGE